ncbi:MAG: heavy metal translocating P-type ATPase, partial [Candidatus Heimdallarchaeota archaeon]
MSTVKKTYKIIGLDCAGCVKTLERKLSSLDGIEDLRIDIAYKRMHVEFSAKLVTSEKIEERVRKETDEDKESLTRTSHSIAHLVFTRRDFYTTLVSGIFLLVGALLEFVFHYEIAAQVTLICATIVGGIFIFKKAFFSLKGLNIDINILMSVAAIAALIIQEEVEAASIVFLFSVAEIVENVSIDRSKRSIEDLIDFAPSEASLITRDGEVIVPASSVAIGKIIVVKSGDRIPLDGIISKGQAHIDQASITGESMPVLKTKGDEVFAGTLCVDSILKIKTTKDYKNIFLRKIIELVENTDQRAPIERFVDVFAKYYTPIMFLISLITMIVPPLVTGDPFIDWVYKALIILVISCPCAVVLSTPITIVAAISRSAKNGILIKGGVYIERLSKTKVFAFDKTGTLTLGHPQVKDIITIETLTTNDLLQIAGSLEVNSKHPIAKAVREYMHEQEIESINVLNFESLTGKGVLGEINGEVWFVG